jgi:uncharacterized protein
MAIKAPKRSGGKSDIKTTIIFVLSLVVIIQGFMLWIAKPAIKPVVIPSTVVPVKPVKKVPPGSAGRIAFVLDDWGYTTVNCKYLKAIKDPLNIAILPNLKQTDMIAHCAHDNGHTVMLHLPLQPWKTGDAYPDNYLITVDMKAAEVSRLVLDSLSKMPLVEGVNNHMGSRATEDQKLMGIIFKHLKKRNLFFVDSMTSPHKSICGELADQMGLPFAARDVFLDNVNSRTEIEKQVKLLAERARQKGSAIAIGHDRDLTLKIIQEQIPLLKAQGFEIVSVKELLRN